MLLLILQSSTSARQACLMIMSADLPEHELESAMYILEILTDSIFGKL